MPRLRFPWLTLLVLSGLALPGAGHAQNAPDGTLTLELLQRIEQLEAEVRQIRGELEIYRHRFDQLQQESARAYAPPTAPAGAAIPPPQAESSPAGSPPADTTVPPVARTMPSATGTAQADFETALRELREGHHARAIAELQHFLSAYPDSSQAGDAQYWLGEAHYLSRDYAAAKEAFINLGVRYPESARLPDALLKLGYIYGEAGETDRAREVLQKLVQAYPDTQAANLAERRLQALR